jgi:hypothetical protein
MNAHEYNKLINYALPKYIRTTLVTALVELRIHESSTDNIELNLLLDDTSDTGTKVTPAFKRLEHKLTVKLVTALGSKEKAVAYLVMVEQENRELEATLVLCSANRM